MYYFQILIGAKLMGGSTYDKCPINAKFVYVGDFSLQFKMAEKLNDIIYSAPLPNPLQL